MEGTIIFAVTAYAVHIGWRRYHCEERYNMQSVQRQVGKFLTRSADGSQVSVLLKDFEDADKMLTKVGQVASV